MNILITGAKGFVGKNLTAALNGIRSGADTTRPELTIGELYLYDVDSPRQLLETACQRADFVFHLAGVNRPKNPEEFTAGNVDFTALLLNTLKKYHNPCPILLSSSIQASLSGRYADSAYGKSKRTGEELLFAYGRNTGAQVMVYRLPNLFGKWCRPNYNSVVATFCHNYTHDFPITVSDPDTELELLYIDDLVTELLDALEGKPHRAGDFCAAPITHRATLGQIVALLNAFRAQPETLMMPPMPPGSFEKKLYSTYLSYLPGEKAVFSLKTHADANGSFSELLRTPASGQFSVNILKPGVTKGNHWHSSKWELFLVAAGYGCIRQRRLGTEEILSFPVSGDKQEAVRILPGYAHSITNLSETEDLVTLIWANECYDPSRPDTFFEVV